jgi:hypothetical protein
LKAVPPTVPSFTSTKEKSKIPSQFSLDHVASFIADLKGKVVATHSTCVGGPYRPMLFLNLEGAPTNNISNVKRRPHPLCTLGRARRSREDGFERRATRKTKRLKKADGPTREARKTKMLSEINGSESNDIDAGLSGGKNDTSHAKAPDDSNYSKEDE